MLRMSECYRPRFTYRKSALSAKEALSLFTNEFHFLPDCSSEPAALADLIQRILYEQQDLPSRPSCPKHQIVMIRLGAKGYALMRPKRRMHVATMHTVGNSGKLMVAMGMYRCPSPGCFLVAPIEE